MSLTILTGNVELSHFTLQILKNTCAEYHYDTGESKGDSRDADKTCFEL